jgi:hypothetical protein
MKVEPKELFDGMWECPSRSEADPHIVNVDEGACTCGHFYHTNKECHHIRQVREFIKNQTKDTE